MARIRKDRKERKQELIEAGIALAVKIGPNNVTRTLIGEKCKCSESLVGVYLGHTKELRKMLARECKKRGLTIPTEEKQAAISLKMWHAAPGRNPDTAKAVAKKAGSDKIKEKAPAKKSTAGAGAAKRAVPVKPAAVETKPVAAGGKAKNLQAPKKKAAIAKKSVAAVPASQPAATSSSSGAKPTKRTAAKAPELPPLPPIVPDLPPLPVAPITG